MTQYYRLMALSMAVVMFYGGMIWYVFPDIDKTISWEGHLAGLITGFFFAAYYKTPDYKKAILYDWEKPDFNPEEDMFMKHFDENGNFVNTSEPEELIVEITPTPAQYVYVFKETPNDTKQSD